MRLSYRSGFTLTDGDGHEVLLVLAAKLLLRSGAYGDVRTVFRSVALDQRTIQVERFTGGAEEVEAVIRYQGDAEALRMLLREGADGRLLTYYPDLAVPAEAYPMALMDYGAVVRVRLDSGRYAYNEWEAPVHLRRVDGGSLAGLATGRLATYRSGSPLHRATFTRATAGTRISAGRVVESIASGLRRITWIERDGVLRPVTLFEDERTNVYDFSDDLTNAAWNKARLTAASSGGGGPKGEVGGVHTLTETTDDGQHHISQALPALTDDTRQSVSWWVRSSLRTWCLIQSLDKANTTRRTWVNLSTGVVGTTDAGHTVVIVKGRQDGSRRWVRISVTWDSASGATTPTAHLMTATADGVSSFAGDDSTQALFVWNPQFEVDGPHPTSDIVTTSATDETRNGDRLILDHEFGPVAQSIPVRFVELGHPPWVLTAGGSPRIVHVGDNTNPRLLLFKSVGGAGDQYSVQHLTAGGVVTSTVDLDPFYGNEIELLPKLFDDGAVQLLGRKNGGSIVSGTKSAALPLEPAWSAQRLHIGSVGAVGFGDIGLDGLDVLRDTDHDFDRVFAALPRFGG